MMRLFARRSVFLWLGLAPFLAGAAEVKDGAAFTLERLPAELTARVPEGSAFRLRIEENATTGYTWEETHNTNECEAVLRHEAAEERRGLCGAPGRVELEVRSRVQTPARLELAYRRPWEKTCAPLKKCRVIVYTVGRARGVSANYPTNAVNALLAAACRARGITITDWHLHIRGGMTPELAAARELASGIRSSAMENHGREWEVATNERLRAFAENARKVRVGGQCLPVGIQVNDRDWFKQIDPETRTMFDYILADTMIMGHLPDGRDNRLWLPQSIPDPEAWMEHYVAHNLQILDEPISILANPTYLPQELAGLYDKLWTDERMRAVIAKAVAHGIALEIQAGSPYPRPKFLRLAKQMGAKFSFGTNNFDQAPKDLSRWLEVIEELDLHGSDIWNASRRSN